MFTKRFSLSLIVLFVFATTVPTLKPVEAAGDPICLRGVMVKMKDGSELCGYVAWSRDYFQVSRKEPKFPQSLIDPDAGYQEETLGLVTEIHQVSDQVTKQVFPNSGTGLLATTTSGELELQIDEIAEISAYPMKYDGWDATDGLQGNLSIAELELLMNGKPSATFDDNEGTVLVSFNRQIGRQKLKAIMAELSKFRNGSDESRKAREKIWQRLEAQKVVSIWYRASC